MRNATLANARSLAAWTAPGADDSVWIVPASVLSNESYTRQMERWIEEGGHLVLLIEYAESEINDWKNYTPDFDPDRALLGFLSRAGIKLETSVARGEPVKATRIRFQGKRFDVAAESRAAVSAGEKKPGVFVSVGKGDGRLSVLTDARIFRNRWIGDKQHAALLEALIDASPNEGDVAFMRGSGLSLWGMLAQHLWPVLLGLAVLTLLWLWKNLTRFGPIEAVAGASGVTRIRPPSRSARRLPMASRQGRRVARSVARAKSSNAASA